MSHYKDFLGLDHEQKNKKRCSKCRHYLPRTKYHKDKKQIDGLHNQCKECRREGNKLNNIIPHQDKEAWANHLYRAYGITVNEYYRMMKDQDGVCAICEKEESVIDPRNNKPKRLCVDHNHITGDVRGLLCSNCNLGIGYLKSDEGVDLLIQALCYIEAHDLEYEF